MPPPPSILCFTNHSTESESPAEYADLASTSWSCNVGDHVYLNVQPTPPVPAFEIVDSHFAQNS